MTLFGTCVMRLYILKKSQWQVTFRENNTHLHITLEQYVGGNAFAYGGRSKDANASFFSQCF